MAGRIHPSFLDAYRLIRLLADTPDEMPAGATAFHTRRRHRPVTPGEGMLRESYDWLSRQRKGS